MRRPWCIAVTLGLVWGTGCGVDYAYVIPAAAGQARLLRDALPVEQALAGENLTEETAAALALIDDVRIYARDVIGLAVGDNYTTFYDSGGEPVAFNISASRRDAFEPYLWTFPIVGTVPYLGYFDVDAVQTLGEELTAQGLDVFIYEIDAYSGLGYFPNPILSPMLDRTELDLIDTVIHELLHATIWRPSDTSFNESLATFYGRQGAREYLFDRHPDEPERIAAATRRFQDIDRFNEFARGLFNELEDFYSSTLSADEKVTGREAVYQAGRERFVADVQPLMHDPARYEWIVNLPTNNAYMLGIRRYNLDLEVFEQVFQGSGEDWRGSLEVFREAAEANDPYSFLRAYLEGDALQTARGRGKRCADGADVPLRSPARGMRPHDLCAHHRATTLVPTD